MTRAIRAALNDLAGQAAAEAGIPRELIFEAVIVGNPIMHHLVLGIDPTELGQAPFALATADALNLWAEEIELRLHQDARIYFLPCIAGHVGADAAAVALSEAPDRSEELMLVVDVGTNAEILLGNRNRVLACSSPTGPAFEGAQISSGQRAAPGAIERVEIDPVTKEPRFRIIGTDAWSDDPAFPPDARVTGICGSGIIEAIAEMRAAGLVDASGLIGSAEQTGTDRCPARPHPRLPPARRHPRHPRRRPRHPAGKSALYAGARLLMDEFHTDTVDRIVLAGAFGAHISPKHAMILGMIPDCDLARVTSAGNAAGTGARIALLNVAARREVERSSPASTRSRPPSSRASRSISSPPTPSRTRPPPSRTSRRCPRSASTPTGRRRRRA